MPAVAASEVLSEEHLHALYGVDIKRLPFEHKGHAHETSGAGAALRCACGADGFQQCRRQALEIQGARRQICHSSPPIVVRADI